MEKYKHCHVMHQITVQISEAITDTNGDVMTKQYHDQLLWKSLLTIRN